jgi:hypothetical protein
MARTIPALLLLVLTTVGHADTLLLDGIDTDAQTASMRPKSGMSMDSVEARYGAPAQRHSAVGEPPITRWDYPDFSVYFERQLVIHAVARR